MPLTQEILTAAAKALGNFTFVAPNDSSVKWLKAEFEKTKSGDRTSMEGLLKSLTYKGDATDQAAAIKSVMELFTSLDETLTKVNLTSVGMDATAASNALKLALPKVMGATRTEYTNAINLIKDIQSETMLGMKPLQVYAQIPSGISHEDIRKAEKAAMYLGLDKEIFRECFDENYVGAVAKIDAAIVKKFPTPTPEVQAVIDKAKPAVLKLMEAVFDAREDIEGIKSVIAHAGSAKGEQPKFLKDIDAKIAAGAVKEPVEIYKEAERKKHENTLQVLENIHKGFEWEATLPDPHKGMELESKGGRKKFFSEEFKEMKTECENKYKAAGWKVVAGDPKATADMGKNFSIKTADEKTVLVDGSTEDHVKISRSACEASGIKGEEEIGKKMIMLAVEGAKLKGLTEVAINSCPKALEKELIEALGKAGIKGITDEQLTKKVKACDLFNPAKGKGKDPKIPASKKWSEMTWSDLRPKPSPWK